MDDHAATTQFLDKPPCLPQDSSAAPYLRQTPQSDLRLYLEVPSAEGRPLHQRAPDEFLLFFKLYDPVQQRLAYLGSFYARKAQKLPDLVPALNKMAGFPEGTALEVCSTCLHTSKFQTATLFVSTRLQKALLLRYAGHVCIPQVFQLQSFLSDSCGPHFTWQTLGLPACYRYLPTLPFMYREAVGLACLPEASQAMSAVVHWATTCVPQL